MEEQFAFQMHGLRGTRILQVVVYGVPCGAQRGFLECGDAEYFTPLYVYVKQQLLAGGICDLAG